MRYGTGSVYWGSMHQASGVVESNRPLMTWRYTWTDEFGKVWRNNADGGATDKHGHDFSGYINDVSVDRWVKAVVRFADGTTCSTTFYSSLRNECSGSACTPPTTVRQSPF